MKASSSMIDPMCTAEVRVRPATRRSCLVAALLMSPLPMGYQAHAAQSGESEQRSTDPGGYSVRISPSQYVESVHAIFGTSIAINGRFEPETRASGLLAIGARNAGITDVGLERYDDLARSIAEQVVSERHRRTLIPCSPPPSTFDDACARSFFASAGRLLYRRPLLDGEVDTLARVARDAAGASGDFYRGLSVTLSTMLISPKFLFRYTAFEPAPGRPGVLRMDAISKAGVLSSLLWNAGPDDQLLRAAESGELHDEQKLAAQVDRLISSPRLEQGIRAFFSDMLGFDKFENLSKDPVFFPRFTLRTRSDAQEQTLRTIVYHIMQKQGDYRDLFVTRETFLTRSLAATLNVPLAEVVDNAQPQRWLPYTYPEGDPRVGILSHLSFVGLHSPSGRTSPTDRGKALRELILCQNVPPPPGNIEFTLVQDINNQKFKTARDRLTAHASEPMCAGCHRITDPMGYALEVFDSAGGYRTTENGAQIDTSGELSGTKFTGPAGLGKAIRDNPAAASCVARRAFAFGAGQVPPQRDAEWKRIESVFSQSGYNFIVLLREIARSELMFTQSSTIQASAGHGQ